MCWDDKTRYIGGVGGREEGAWRGVLREGGRKGSDAERSCREGGRWMTVVVMEREGGCGKCGRDKGMETRDVVVEWV